MPKALTTQQVEQYHELGFISPIDVMSEDEALCYKERLEAVEQNYPDEINAENRNNAHLSLACLDELAHHPVVIDAVEDLIGPNIDLWGSVLFIKDPQSSGYVSWHQDATYMGFNANDFVTPWIALTPSNRKNGCMTMIPGSHKQHIRKHDDTFEDNNILTRGQVVSGVDACNGVDLILRPGQMSLHHGETIHGSQPNRSQHRRIGYALQAYMPPHVQQIIGENQWLPIRGDSKRKDCVSLTRPLFDMHPQGVVTRKFVNKNFSDILYHGAKKRRAY
ncbi:MAG: phytanoyl-CoA dioxygenase family protein [Arenicellales bacterium WSBS_2016_MAG_OTU3]